MSRYFSHFPTVNYNGREMYDITRRGRFRSDTMSNPLLYLPYTVKDYERPEDIAYDYYGSVDYTWLILMANNMVDPYHDWPLDSENFEKYIMKKYEAVSKKKGYDVLHWSQNQTIFDNVVYFYKYDTDDNLIKTNNKSLIYTHLYTENGQTITSENYEDVYFNVEPIEGYDAYRVYDYEYDLNEQKREINVVDMKYLSRIETEFRELIKK